MTHYFNGNFIYDLPLAGVKPLARERRAGSTRLSAAGASAAFPAVHSGDAYFAASNAFVAGYANNAPAILTGPISDLKIHINGGKGQALYAFANPTQANADFVGPVGFNIGTRNNLRGPGYFNMDMGLAKTFPLWSERVVLKFRADAFNVLNHPNFSTPCTDITNVSCLFGNISSTVGTGINNNGDALARPAALVAAGVLGSSSLSDCRFRPAFRGRHFFGLSVEALAPFEISRSGSAEMLKTPEARPRSLGGNS